MGDLTLRYPQPVTHETSPPAPLLVWTPLHHPNSRATYSNTSPALSGIFYKGNKKKKKSAFKDITSNKAPTFSIILKIRAHVAHPPRAELTQREQSGCWQRLSARGPADTTSRSALDLHREQSNGPRDAFSAEPEVMETRFLQLMQGVCKTN